MKTTMQRRPDDHSLLKRRECTSETVEIAVIRRQTEAQQIVGPLETPAPDVLRGERSVHLDCIGAPHEPKQSGSADQPETRFCQHGVELARLVLERVSRAARPFMVAQRGRADGQGRSGASPWTKRRSDALRDIFMRDGKSQPEPRETVKLSERTQDHNGQIRA